MPLLDLSQTTVALQRLLQFNIPLLEPSLNGVLTVSTLPPERVQAAANLLSLYCYHVAPDPSNRIRARQTSGPRPVATSPLTVKLYYILTAHTFSGTEFNALAEQRLLGYAMKTFHDHAVIDDATRVDGQIVLPDEIRGRHNSFSITQLVLTPAEALSYWTNEAQNSVKPSCYYEVVSAELEPDPPDRLPGIVLQVGSYVFPRSAPAIAQASANVPFTRPASLGGGPASLRASPARIGPMLLNPPPANVLRLDGQGFAGGGGQRLLLSHPFWARNFPGGTVPVDPALNGATGWATSVADDTVEVVLGDVLQAIPPGGGAPVDLALYPGVYTACWEVTRTVVNAMGTEVIRERSNAVPVLVYPCITGFELDNVTGAVTLQFAGAWLLTRGRPAPADPLTAPELAIDLSVDGRAYRLVAGTVPAGAGTYAIGDHALVYQPNPEESGAGEHAIRVVVDGADSQPFWVALP
jgi:hypothetical protein